MKWFLLVLHLAWLYTIKSWPEYHQDDYDVKFEKVIVSWYNHTYVRYLKWHIGWYNRTVRAMNLSGYLLYDVGFSDDDIVGVVQAYKMASNEYRYFPMSVSIKFCAEYRANFMKVKDLLAGISNVHNCPINKGYYWIRTNGAMVDFSLLPPYIPRGQYKLHGKIFLEGVLIGEGDAYGSIVDKPLKWN